MADLSAQQAHELLGALKRAGVKTEGLRPINPFGLDTPKARELQAIVQSVDPALAQRLAAEMPESLEYRALQHQLAQGDVNLTELPEHLRREVELRNHDQLVAQQQAQEAAYLERMEQAAEALHKQQQDAGLAPRSSAPAGRWGRWAADQQALAQAGL